MSLEKTASRYSPYILSIMRIIVALLILQHGLSKMIGWPASNNRPVLFTLLWFAGAIELVFGALLAAGFWTRLAAFILSGEMAFAYFMAHAPRGFFPQLNGGEGAILFCFAFLYIAFAGGGPLSVDAMQGNSRGLFPTQPSRATK
jgi:putative oxidoreductase